jgi:thiamine-phosphate pyrophosphorylase
MSVPALYPLVDVDLCRARRLAPLAVLAAFLEGGARFIQLRDKQPSTAARLALADAAVALTRAAGARLVVNDRADVARLSGADGVHVGQEDLSVEDTRLVVGAGVLIGVSTHDRAQLEAALATTADYVAVGPVYGTATKDTGYSARGLDLVRDAARLAAERGGAAAKPIVAIGGITLERAPEVLAAGAASVAVIYDQLTRGEASARVPALLVCVYQPPV